MDDPRDGLWQTYKAFMMTLKEAMATMSNDDDSQGMIARAKAAAARAGIEGFLRGLDVKIAKSLQEMSPDDARLLCARILNGFEAILGPLRAYTAPNGSDGPGGDDRLGKDDARAAVARLLSGSGGS